MVQPRVRATGQHKYWRRVQVPLHAQAAYTFTPFVGIVPETPFTASTGPQGVGESWTVDLVQVQSGPFYGTAPLVVQQIQAQQQGSTLAPPPPIVAQVWLSVGGVNVHLLGQTPTGGNDDLDVGGVTLTAGERITVVWYNVALVILEDQIPSLWFVARGTKTVLSADG